MVDIEKLKKQIAEKELEVDNLNSEICQLNKQLKQLIIEQKAFETDFLKYANKHIEKITLIIKENNEIIFDSFHNCNVDARGHIYAYHWGEMSHYGYAWFDSLSSYATDSCFDDEHQPVKILGYIDLVVDD